MGDEVAVDDGLVEIRPTRWMRRSVAGRRLIREILVQPDETVRRDDPVPDRGRRGSRRARA